MNWIFIIILCAAFLGILKLLDNALAEENARRRRIRRLKKNQDHALECAEDLRNFDKILTKERLIRAWEELQC